MNLAAAIRAAAPRADADRWATVLAAPMRSSGVTTPRRAGMFIGQVAVESAGFSTLVESLNYTHADRLCAVWPLHFPNAAAAAACVGNPERLANLVYAGRNGNAEADDGWRFRGRGLIQLTGRFNYTRCAGDLKRPVDDEFLTWCATDAGAAATACWFWSQQPALNPHADDWDVAFVTRRINGGMTGYADRVKACLAARSALS